MPTQTDDLKRLLHAEHWDPFSLLGPHRAIDNGGAWVVRAFLPEAQEASVVVDGQDARPIEMRRVHPDGLYEASLETARDGRYRIRVRDRWGQTTERHDPYAFPNLLTDFDLHLFAEGKHYRAYDTLGAHLRTVRGVQGVHFVVWAPNAMRVSVVGDFNHWDGRRHPMRTRGATGLWELFLPDLPECTIYKYEIRPRNGGAPFLKADPFALASEMRPKTASVVRDLSRYEWRDADWMAQRRQRNWFEQPIAIYEVHFAAWRRGDGGRWLTYRELTEQLVPYAKKMGYTHLELMPVAEH